MSAGSYEVSRRMAPRIIATRIAAVRPLPETSPTIAVSRAIRVGATKKKSPPTSLAGRYTDSTSKPGVSSRGARKSSCCTPLAAWSSAA